MMNLRNKIESSMMKWYYVLFTGLLLITAFTVLTFAVQSKVALAIIFTVLVISAIYPMLLYLVCSNKLMVSEDRRKQCEKELHMLLEEYRKVNKELEETVSKKQKKVNTTIELLVDSYNMYRRMREAAADLYSRAKKCSKDTALKAVDVLAAKQDVKEVNVEDLYKEE